MVNTEELIKTISALQELLDIYTEAEGFTSLASKNATLILRKLREEAFNARLHE